MNVSLTLDKIYAKGRKVKTVTIVLFKVGPLLLGSCKLVGRFEDDALILRELSKPNTKITLTEQGKETAHHYLPLKAAAA